MPLWVYILLALAVIVGIALWLPKRNTLPSGNEASQPATLNASGFTYGNLT